MYTNPAIYLSFTRLPKTVACHVWEPGSFAAPLVKSSGHATAVAGKVTIELSGTICESLGFNSDFKRLGIDLRSSVQSHEEVVFDLVVKTLSVSTPKSLWKTKRLDETIFVLCQD